MFQIREVDGMAIAGIRLNHLTTHLMLEVVALLACPHGDSVLWVVSRVTQELGHATGRFQKAQVRLASTTID